MCNGTLFTFERLPYRAGLEPGTAESLGQCLTFRVTGAPKDLSIGTVRSKQTEEPHIRKLNMDMSVYGESDAKRAIRCIVR